MNLPDGHLLQNGKYRLNHVVGQGGFGITYKGIWYTEVKGSLGTVKTEVPICVKEYFFKDYCYREPTTKAVMVHSETGKALFDRFKEKLIKEAKILSEVHHPYIVNVLEVFEENNTAYIAMEYISGFSLKYVLEKRGVLPEATVLRYVRQIGEALSFVHEKNILHLDIKPSNILIDKNGNARLIDFGVSKRYDMEQEETSTTMLTLSKGFASIEQYDNEGIQAFSPRPDIYSLGATMYNLLTGKIPVESILRATRPLPKPTAINPSITSQTEAVILKAMQIVPADRFGSVEEMMAGLDFSMVKEEVKEPLLLLPAQEEEETTLVSQTPKPNEVDEDETLVNQPVSPRPTLEQGKAKKKSKLIPIGIAACVAVGATGAFLVWEQGLPKAVAEQVELPSMPVIDEPVSEVTDPDGLEELEYEAAMVDEPGSLDEMEEIMIASEENFVTTKESEATTPKAKAVEEEMVASHSPSEAEINARYESLLASGKEKMDQADYEAARRDLMAAKDTKLTEEVLRLIIACDELAEEQRIAEKKAGYEEKMAFGGYMIVRKKSNNKYGAIDSNGEERIPCKYLNVGLTENGRAFEREDGLFDIYDTKGTLVSEGLTYY